MTPLTSLDPLNFQFCVVLNYLDPILCQFGPQTLKCSANPVLHETKCDAAHVKGGGGALQLWAFLDIDKNTQKTNQIIEKTVKKNDPFS